MKIDMELADGALAMALHITTTPDVRIGSPDIITLYRQFFEAVMTLLEAVPEEEQYPIIIQRLRGEEQTP